MTPRHDAMGTHAVEFSDEQLNSIHADVFRDSVSSPGFYFADLGSDIDSKTFRRTMIDLKEGLNRVCEVHSNKHLTYQWLGRFDHQHTSMFHRDNAASLSFLMLGYEPTEIDSRVFVADYSKLIESKGLSLSKYFGGEEARNTAPSDGDLEPFTTELVPFPKNTYRLLLLNNSRSFDEATYGVFHRGEAIEKIEGADRVINSMMLNLGDDTDAPDSPEVRNFLDTDVIAR